MQEITSDFLLVSSSRYMEPLLFCTNTFHNPSVLTAHVCQADALERLTFCILARLTPGGFQGIWSFSHRLTFEAESLSTCSTNEVHLKGKIITNGKSGGREPPKQLLKCSLTSLDDCCLQMETPEMQQKALAPISDAQATAVYVMGLCGAVWRNLSKSCEFLFHWNFQPVFTFQVVLSARTERQPCKTVTLPDFPDYSPVSSPLCPHPWPPPSLLSAGTFQLPTPLISRWLCSTTLAAFTRSCRSHLPCRPLPPRRPLPLALRWLSSTLRPCCCFSGEETRACWCWPVRDCAASRPRAPLNPSLALPHVTPRPPLHRYVTGRSLWNWTLMALFSFELRVWPREQHCRTLFNSLSR